MKTAAKEDNAACGCASQGQDRKAVAVDPLIKSENTNRLRRIEGQVRGLQRMVAEERYCADILVQISSVQQALHSVAKSLLRNHLRHCAAQAIQKGTRTEAEAMYNELVDLIEMHGC